MTPNAAQRHDHILEARIQGLQSAIEIWARSSDLWYDCAFRPYLERTGREPCDEPVVTVLCFDGPLYQVFNGTYDDGALDEFGALLDKLGFEYVLDDAVSVHISPTDPAEIAAFADYFRWQWICSLVQPDFADVYEEVYGHFQDRPEDLNRLDWREFEILLSGVFQHQGFEVELGPGSGDGGVDLRLLQRDPLGDVLTLVQAKRYAPNRKIKLEAVQALHGAWAVEKADRSLFVTTSEYLPSARSFAGRTDGTLDLATSVDVAAWCQTARAGVIEDKSLLVSDETVRALLIEAQAGRLDRVVHATRSYGSSGNQFGLILKQTRRAALIMALPRTRLSGDAYQGTERPRFDEAALAMRQADTVWRAKRSEQDGHISYWDGYGLYSVWNGQPAWYDHYD